MENLEDKTNNQLYGRLGYMTRVCKDCDFPYCGGCDFAVEKRKITDEIKKRKKDN